MKDADEYIKKQAEEHNLFGRHDIQRNNLQRRFINPLYEEEIKIEEDSVLGEI